MKRLIVVSLILAITAIGLTAFANPMNVGGEMATAIITSIHGGGSDALAHVPSHANASGLREKQAALVPMLLSSPMNVGGE